MWRLAPWVETLVQGCELRLRGRGIEVALELDSPHLSVELARALGQGLQIEDALRTIALLGRERDAIRMTLAAHGLIESSQERKAFIKPPLSHLYANLQALLHMDHGLLWSAHASAMRLSVHSLWGRRGVSSGECAAAGLHFGTCLSSPLTEKGTQARGESAQDSQLSAITVAMMEALERIFTIYRPPSCALESVPRRSIKAPSLSPEVLQNSGSFDDDTGLDWVVATRLSDGAESFVPLCSVTTTSNGAASHSSFADAALNGIIEIVERDSLLYCWLTRRSPAIIADTDKVIARVPLAASLRRLGFRITLLDGDAGLGIPVLLGIFEDDHNPAVFMLNAASGATLDEALSKLCREFVMVMRDYFESGEMPAPTVQFGEDSRSLRSPHEHFDYYQTDARTVATSFLTASSVRRTESELDWQLPGSDEHRLESVVQHLARNGVEVFAVDCSSKPLRELGIEVVKILAPGTIPMYFDERHRPVSVPRLRTQDSTPLNPWPHPYG
ncbi:MULTISPECIES: YcaO-like family protein [unclassified Cupriavidus]|uniref:YcaO-like family protein n=1 Tax=unclassified Cupriavidus TaxID=2640874 RepID=UPI00313E707C